MIDLRRMRMLNLSIGNRKLDRRMVALARRMAVFAEDYDPYGFRDAMSADTIDEEIELLTLDNYECIKGGDFAFFTEWVDPETLTREMMREYVEIMDEIDYIKSRLVKCQSETNSCKHFKN